MATPVAIVAVTASVAAAARVAARAAMEIVAVDAEVTRVVGSRVAMAAIVAARAGAAVMEIRAAIPAVRAVAVAEVIIKSHSESVSMSKCDERLRFSHPDLKRSLILCAR